MACYDEVIPSQKRIETAAAESDLEEVYVTALTPASEFLDDLNTFPSSAQR